MYEIANEDFKWTREFNDDFLHHVRGYQIYTIVMIGLNVLHIPAALTSHEFLNLDRNKIKCHVCIAWIHYLTLLVSCVLEITVFGVLDNHYTKSHSA